MHKLTIVNFNFSMYIYIGDFMYKLKIKQYRINKHIRQFELAKKLNISQNYLSELEHVKYPIKISTLYKIAKALDVCPKDLIECNCPICKKKDQE